MSKLHALLRLLQWVWAWLQSKPWFPVALMAIGILAGCSSCITIPDGCIPSWNHVVGRADREPSVWTLGILCERGAAPRIVPGEPL